MIRDARGHRRSAAFGLAFQGRASDLGYVDYNRTRYLYQQMSAKGYRMQEPVQIDKEEPKVVQQLFSCFIDTMNYDPESFAAFLRSTKQEVEILYDVKFKKDRIERPKLRIVSSN